MNEVPSWLVECIQDTRKLFGVGDDWSIAVRLSDHPNGESDNDGACHLDATYLNATLEFARDLDDQAEARQVVMHEIGHIAHAEVDMIVEAVLDGLPKRERKYFYRMYRACVERYLQRLARAMVRHIQPLGDNDSS